MSGTTVIRTEGLTKQFGRMTVVDGLDLEVHEGDLFGFLGPNGSGKTTTVRMLLGLVFATAGRVELLGREMPAHASAVLPHVGALVEGPGFYPDRSGRRNLALIDAAGPAGPTGPAGRRGSRKDRRDRIEEALERVGLAAVGRRPVKGYSTGMRQRLGLAGALLRRPRLLVLDEPTNGLDPQGIREVRTLLVELAQAGTTVFVSSHLLAEVEAFCDRAAIVHRGRLVAQDRVESLLAPTGTMWVETPDVEMATAVVSGLDGPSVEGEDRPDGLRIWLDGMPPEELNARFVGSGVRVRELVRERLSLEEVFIRLTGETTRVDR